MHFTIKNTRRERKNQMYVKLDMLFNKESDIPDFGSIQLVFTGKKEQGYLESGNKRFRKYVFLSQDLSKLNLITNALNGSIARAIDTGKVYILLSGTWTLTQSSGSGGSSSSSEEPEYNWGELSSGQSQSSQSNPDEDFWENF